MKTLAILFLPFFATVSWAIEIAPLGKLPIDADSWTIVDRGSLDREDWKCTWLTVKNKQNGSLLAIRIDRLDGLISPAVALGGVWTEMPLNVPGGEHSTGKNPEWENATATWSASELVEIVSKKKAVRSQVYWEMDGRMRLAHGLGFAVDDHMVYLQHTSEMIITPETVRSIAEKVLSNMRKRESDSADQSSTRKTTANKAE